MCDKAILENGGTLMSAPKCYKNHEMCNKSVDNYSHSLELVPECYKIQKMCEKAVDTYPTTIKYVPEYYKTRKMCNKAGHEWFLHLLLFLINIKLKKYHTLLLLYIYF